LIANSLPDLFAFGKIRLRKNGIGQESPMYKWILCSK